MILGLAQAAFSATTPKAVKDSVAQTVCLASGEAYEWYDKDCTTSGIYRYTEKDQSGKDSVYHILNLTVNKEYHITKRIPVCNQSSVYYNGKTYTEDADIIDKYQTVEGCDSIITTEIRFGQEFRRRDTLIIRASDAKPIYWHGKEIKGPGLITDQYISQQGCDSTYELMVFVEEDNIKLTVAAICQVDTPYTWRDQSFSEVGVYYRDDTLRTQDESRDSLIYRLYLTINENPTKTYSINLCPGSSQTYRGKLYKTEGIYYDTIPSVTGCDTITKVVVTNLPNHVQVDSVRLWPGRTYTWRNDSVYTWKDANREDIFISGTNQYGCDSSYRLIITYLPIYQKTEDIDFCWSKEEPYYYWRNKYQLGKDTTVYDTAIISSLTDPDTIITLNLHVYYPSEPTYLYREICGQGRSVEDFPHIKTPGIHYDTLTNRHGCDSVLIINVKYNPQDTTFYKRIQYGTTIDWYGQTLGAEEGLYDYIPDKHTVGLCDTVYRLDLKWWYPFARNYHDTICEQRLAAGEMYIWKQDEYEIPFRLNKDENGYRDSIFYNRDSTHWLNLHVVKQNIHRDTIHLCEGSSYHITWSDGSTHIMTTEGYYRDTFPSIGANRHACDSIVEYWVNVHKVDRKALPDVHVPDTATQYVWEIREWNKSITLPVHKELGYEYFYDTLRSISFGCDSVIYRLKLITDTTYFFEEHVTICHTYTWEGHLKQGKPYIVEKAGVYWDSLRTRVTNVDSVYKLVVDTLPHYLIRENREICQGDSLDFFGEWIKAAGTYRHMDYTKAHGCDSITEWILNIIPVASPTLLTVNRSDKEIPYQWVCRNADGSVKSARDYSWTGTYRDTVLSSRGCDSILILNFKVWPTYNADVLDTAVCASQLPFVWHDKKFTSDTVYVDSMKTVMHYDSLVTLKLKVLPIDTTYLDIDMCYKHPYTYNGTTYTQGGRYIQRLTNHLGCDSIIMLQIRELGQIMTSQEVHVNDSYTWHVPTKPDKTYNSTGTYYDTLTAVNGCDSILELRLTIHEKEIINNHLVQECEDNLPYLWRKIKPIYNDTVLMDTVKSNMVDTIHVITFQVLRTTRDTIYPILCDGDFYEYSGQRYTRDTLIHDTAYSELGCARHIHSIDMRFRKVKFIDFPITTSDAAPYEWLSPSGKTYTVLTKDISTGRVELTDTVRYKDGLCDSIRYHLSLTVGRTYYFSDSVHLCLPDTIYWHGQQITEAGVYYDNLQTTGFGYDSIYQLIVGAHNSTVIKENYRIPYGTTQYIHGIAITETGKYSVRYFDHSGCDSIYEFNVNVIHPNIVIDKDTTICEGDYINFYGNIYTKADTYHYTSPEGDSVVNLTLHVNRTDITRMDTVIGSYIAPPYIIHNKEYMQAGMYYDTLPNRFHCDSVIVLHLIITDRVSAWDLMPLCPGAQIKIDNMVITRPGQYTFVRPSVTQQLDSLYRVHVYDAPAYDLPTEVREICQGDTVDYGGKKFTTSGVYTMYFKTKNGCDSIMHLDLTVHPTYHHDTILTIADYDQPVKWFNSTYDSTGVYQHREPTKDFLCDSTFTLKLTVVETRRDTLSDTICSGMTYTWRGKNYTESGLFRDTVRMLDVKQSYIHTLLLDVKDPVLITSASVEENICADTENFDITLSFIGGTPKNYSIRFDELAKRAGFVDVVNEPFDQTLKAHVAIPQFRTMVYQNHTAYVQPNYYSLRIELDNGICGIERSDSIKVLIRYPSWIIEQNWDDIVMPLKKELNGGYEFIKTEWYVNDILQPSTGNVYLQSSTLLPGDEVVMMAVRRGENVAIPSCPIVIKESAPLVHETPVIIYPTQAPRHMPIITIEAPQGGRFAIYSSTGSLLSEGRMSEGTTQVTLPNVSGMYFIRTSQGSDTQTHKVLLY